MSATRRKPHTSLAVNAAARWLKERGVHPHSRHAIYIAIAQKRLRVAASSDRIVLVRRDDLERFAREQKQGGTVAR